MNNAACKDSPPQWFVGELAGWEILRAKSICARCPVVAECRALADSVEVGFSLSDLQGVWGGEDARTRALRRSPNTGFMPKAPRTRSIAGWSGHGSLTMYKSGCKCFECMEASRFHAQDLRRRRKEGFRRRPPTHGTIKRYNTPHGCRCVKCTAAIAKQSAKRRLLAKGYKEWFTIQCEYCGHVERKCDGRYKQQRFCNQNCRRAFNKESNAA